MSNEKLQQKINEYCGSRVCRECIFDDAVNNECLADLFAKDRFKRWKALHRFGTEILGEETPYEVKGNKVDFMFANKEIAEGFVDMVKRDNILDKAIEKFGELQLVKAAEECCELAQALNKHYCNMLCNYPIINSKTNIIEEIADVEIMLLQVKKILEIKEEDLEEIKKQKLERLEKALENVYEEN